MVPAPPFVMATMAMKIICRKRLQVVLESPVKSGFLASGALTGL
jgi:hypothetical protein